MLNLTGFRLGPASLICVLAAGGSAAGAQPVRSDTAVLEPGQCFETWSQAAEFVRNAGLPSLEEVTAADERLSKVRVVKAMLCRNEDGYAYRLVVQDRNGGLRQFKVDTKSR